MLVHGIWYARHGTCSRVHREVSPRKTKPWKSLNNSKMNNNDEERSTQGTRAATRRRLALSMAYHHIFAGIRWRNCIRRSLCGLSASTFRHFCRCRIIHAMLIRHSMPQSATGSGKSGSTFRRDWRRRRATGWEYRRTTQQGAHRTFGGRIMTTLLWLLAAAEASSLI